MIATPTTAGVLSDAGGVPTVRGSPRPRASYRRCPAADALLAAIEKLADDGGVLTSTLALLTSAAELAERHGISVYDAAYATAAGDAGYRLVSCDERDLVANSLASLP